MDLFFLYFMVGCLLLKKLFRSQAKNFHLIFLHLGNLVPMLLGHVMSVQLALGQESLEALGYSAFKRFYRYLQKKVTCFLLGVRK